MQAHLQELEDIKRSAQMRTFYQHVLGKINSFFMAVKVGRALSSMLCHAVLLCCSV